MINKMTPATLTDQFANDARQVMFYGFAVMIATALVFALLSALTIAKARNVSTLGKSTIG